MGEWSEQYSYFGQTQHSIVYFIGHENIGTLWIFGVILSGCSHFFIFLYYPTICVVFAFLSCCICGNREILKPCSDLDIFVLCPMNFMKLFVQLPVLSVMGMSAIGYFGIFIFALELWNGDTFKMNENTVYAIIGVIVVLIILPIYECVIIAIGNSEVDEKRFSQSFVDNFKQNDEYCCIFCKRLRCPKMDCTKFEDKCCKKHKYESIRIVKEANAEIETHEQKL